MNAELRARSLSLQCDSQSLLTALPDRTGCPTSWALGSPLWKAAGAGTEVLVLLAGRHPRAGSGPWEPSQHCPPTAPAAVATVLPSGGADSALSQLLSELTVSLKTNPKSPHYKQTKPNRPTNQQTKQLIVPSQATTAAPAGPELPQRREALLRDTGDSGPQPRLGVCSLLGTPWHSRPAAVSDPRFCWELNMLPPSVYTCPWPTWRFDSVRGPAGHCPHSPHVEPEVS